MADQDRTDDAAYEALARIHDDADARVDELRAVRPDEEVVAHQEEVFKALAHADRLRILSVLDDGECNVYELQVCLDLPQSTVANHLRRLKDAGLVKSRRKGKWSYYRVADVAVFELLELAELVSE